MPGGARLFLPDGFRPANDGTAAFTLHLHGSHESVRESFRLAHRPGVLATLVLPGLSGVYTKHFAADPAGVFFTLLEAARKASGVTAFTSVWVSSFSAGFGGVRELLKAPTVYARLDALILADTLYAGFVQPQKDPAERPLPNPADIRDFVRFATDAANRRDRAMLVTYCDLLPPTYSATRETAAELRRAVGVTPEARQEDWPDGLTLTSYCRKGRFATYGFSGDDGAAHMRHLPGLRYFYRLVPRA